MLGISIQRTKMLHAKSQRMAGQHIHHLGPLQYLRVSGLSTFTALALDQKAVMEVLAIIMPVAEAVVVMHPGKLALQLIREIRLLLQLAQEVQQTTLHQLDQMRHHPVRH